MQFSPYPCYFLCQVQVISSSQVFRLNYLDRVQESIRVIGPM